MVLKNEYGVLDCVGYRVVIGHFEKMKNIRIYQLIIFVLCGGISCSSNNDIKPKTDNRQPVLLATNEAPLGWERLRIYIDSTFEFESYGVNAQELIKGMVNISNDTLYFDFISSQAKLNRIATYNERTVEYIVNDSRRSMDITKSRINESGYDVIPISEIKEILISTFESTNLDSLVNSKEDDTIIIKSFGVINNSTMDRLQISDRKVVVLNEQEIQGIMDYWGIGDWSAVKGKLRLQLFNPMYNKTFNFSLSNEQNKWKIEHSNTIEE